MAAKFSCLAIPEVVLIEPVRYTDERGFMMETWQQKEYAAHGVAVNFVQDNVSISNRGVLRGLHYQVNCPQGKLVRVSRGAVFDVAVDLRRTAPTFGQHVGVVLSDENRFQLWIPVGFAHGFVVVSESAEFSYKCSDFYSPESERTIIWNDPILSIAWPELAIPCPIVSKRDASGVPFSLAEVFE